MEERGNMSQDSVGNHVLGPVFSLTSNLYTPG
jgi:hypothetical protein